MRFQGHVAVVTGGASGIGRAITLSLAREGCTVIIADIDGAAAELVLGEVDDAGGKGEVSVVDVTDFEAVRGMMDSAAGRHGHLDILVTSVTLPPKANWPGLLDASLEEIKRSLDVHMMGVAHCCKAAVPHMRRRGYGRIVNLGSLAAVLGGGMLGGTVYAAAKAGVLGLSRGLAREVATDGITVNAVNPSLIETPRHAQLDDQLRARAVSRVPIGRAGTVDEVSAAVLFLASREASFITGTSMAVDGGATMH